MSDDAMTYEDLFREMQAAYGRKERRMHEVIRERDEARALAARYKAERDQAREEAARLAEGWTEANRREKALEAEAARLREALEEITVGRDINVNGEYTIRDAPLDACDARNRARAALAQAGQPR